MKETRGQDEFLGLVGCFSVMQLVVADYGDSVWGDPLALDVGYDMATALLGGMGLAAERFPRYGDPGEAIATIPARWLDWCKQCVKGLLEAPPHSDAVRDVAEATEGESPSEHGLDIAKNEIAFSVCRSLWRERPARVDGAAERGGPPVARGRGRDGGGGRWRGACSHAWWTWTWAASLEAHPSD